MQHVRNGTTRPVTGSCKYDHIAPVPFQSALVTCWISRDTWGTHHSPRYLTELIEPYCPLRTLRSSFGARSFEISEPILWNSLSLELWTYSNLNLNWNKHFKLIKLNNNNSNCFFILGFIYDFCKSFYSCKLLLFNVLNESNNARLKLASSKFPLHTCSDPSLSQTLRDIDGKAQRMIENGRGTVTDV